MRIKIAILAALIAAGIIGDAMASCPKGTVYQCTPYGGKMQCGCY